VYGFEKTRIYSYSKDENPLNSIKKLREHKKVKLTHFKNQ
jgi:hypothetical protein